MQILLDTNFIMSCVKLKIDFFSRAREVIDDNITWIVPSEVMDELEDISTRKGETNKDKDSAKIGLEVVKAASPKIIHIKNKHVDEGIKNYIRGTKIVLATLDKGLINRVDNRILTIKKSKDLELI